LPALRILHLLSIEDHFPVHYVECSKAGAKLQSGVEPDSPGKTFLQ
jgi:hypothetical protein